MSLRTISLLGFAILFVISCDSSAYRKPNRDDFSYENKLDSIRKVIKDSVAKEKAAYEEKYKPMTRLDSLFHIEIAKINPDYQRLDSLIAAGININSINKYSINVKKSGANIPIIKDFMKKKYREVNIEETPLLYKCMRASRTKFDPAEYKLIKYLLEKGADQYLTPDLQKNNWDGYSHKPLEFIIGNNAFLYGAFQTKYNVQQYISLFKTHGFKMDTINLLCTKGNWELIQYLVKEGAPRKIDIGSSIDMGFSDWRETLEKHFEELKSFELDFSNLDADQLVFFRKTEMLEKLLALGLSPNHVSSQRKIPLLFSVIEKGDSQLAFFKLLVEKYHADTRIRYQGQDLVSFAEKYNQQAIADYLRNIQ